ncbi:class I SAM-dependent methyltransferase [Aeromicrobium sp. CTD01-1L150]|uniref:class I SAM-dependent methyltransferase n=1 Tax=Aeromicrobium sp. CTD01-1L150 TaxID=3341830 RepID=UPI0035BF078F
MRDASRSWRRDHPWAKVYERVSTDERLGPVLWRMGTGSSIEELHRRARGALLDLPPGARVLDVPCGAGVVLRDLPPGHTYDYVAADISPAMLRRTRDEADRRGLAGIETRAADVHALEDPEDSYDLVLTFTGLHCFPDPEGAVHELARVLRPGGRLVGSAFCTDAGRRFTPVHVGGRAIGVLGPGCTHHDIDRWLRDAGLHDVRLERSGAFTYFEGTGA